MSGDGALSGTASLVAAHVEHTVRTLPVTNDRDGSPIALTVHTLRSAAPGPTVTLMGPQHGDEWFTVRVLHDVLHDLLVSDFAGTVHIVPVANPPALRDGVRITQASADEPDMNRAWGSPHTWIAALLTRTLAAEVVDSADVVVDFHMGPSGSTFGAVCFGKDFPDPSLNKRSRELAQAFGYPVVGAMDVATGFPGPRSLAGYAGLLHGIPTVLVEIGGGGHAAGQEDGWAAQTLQGVRNLLIHLQMLSEPPVRPARQLTYTGTRRVNPSRGGLLIPAQKSWELGEPVVSDQVLGTVVCPLSYTVVEELVSPCGGWLFYYAKSQLLRPGDWAFGVIEQNGATWTSDG